MSKLCLDISINDAGDLVILAPLKGGRTMGRQGRNNSPPIPSYILCQIKLKKSEEEIEPGVFVQEGVKRKVHGIFEEVIDIEVCKTKE